MRLTQAPKRCSLLSCIWYSTQVNDHFSPEHPRTFLNLELQDCASQGARTHQRTWPRAAPEAASTALAAAGCERQLQLRPAPRQKICLSQKESFRISQCPADCGKRCLHKVAAPRIDVCDTAGSTCKWLLERQLPIPSLRSFSECSGARATQRNPELNNLGDLGSWSVRSPKRSRVALAGFCMT